MSVAQTIFVLAYFLCLGTGAFLFGGVVSAFVTRHIVKFCFSTRMFRVMIPLKYSTASSNVKLLTIATAFPLRLIIFLASVLILSNSWSISAVQKIILVASFGTALRTATALCAPILNGKRVASSTRTVLSPVTSILARMGWTLTSHGVGSTPSQIKLGLFPVLNIAETMLTYFCLSISSSSHCSTVPSRSSPFWTTRSHLRENGVTRRIVTCHILAQTLSCNVPTEQDWRIWPDLISHWMMTTKSILVRLLHLPFSESISVARGRYWLKRRVAIFSAFHLFFWCLTVCYYWRICSLFYALMTRGIFSFMSLTTTTFTLKQRLISSLFPLKFPRSRLSCDWYYLWVPSKPLKLSSFSRSKSDDLDS